MNRCVLILALIVIAVAGLAPVASMLARVEPADLQGALDARTAGLLGRTMWMGMCTATLAFSLGLPFGFLVARTDLPGASLLRQLGLVPLFLPPLFLAVTLTALAPELRGAPAVVAVLTASSFPLVAELSARAFENVDARQEDAARMAGGLRALLRVELPLVLPSAAAGACLVFAIAINDFAVPDYISSVGIRYNVYADEVFASWQSLRAPGKAVAAALPIVVLSCAALAASLWLRRRMLSGSGSRMGRTPGRLELGRWRWALLAPALAVVGLSALTPLLRLGWEAGGGSKGFGFACMRQAFDHALEVGREDLQRSLLYACGAALGALPVALVVGHACARSRKLRWLEPLVLVPLAVPAILYGIGCIALWNRPATAAFYESGFLVILMSFGRWIAIPVLVVSAAATQLDPRLEDAARMAGAGPLRRLRAIVAPAVRGPWLAGIALVYVFAMRELDAAILVPAANGTAIFRVYNAIHFGRDDFVAALALLIAFLILLPWLLWASFGRRDSEVGA